MFGVGGGSASPKARMGAATAGVAAVGAGGGVGTHH